MLLCPLKNLFYNLFHAGNFSRDLFSRDCIITCMDFLNICFTFIQNFLYFRTDLFLLLCFLLAFSAFFFVSLLQCLLCLCILSICFCARDQACFLLIRLSFQKPAFLNHKFDIFFYKFHTAAHSPCQTFKITIRSVSKCLYIFLEAFQSAKSCTASIDHPHACQCTNQRHCCRSDTAVTYYSLQNLHCQKSYCHTSGKKPTEYDQQNIFYLFASGISVQFRMSFLYFLIHNFVLSFFLNRRRMLFLILFQCIINHLRDGLIQFLIIACFYSIFYCCLHFADFLLHKAEVHSVIVRFFVHSVLL